MVRSIGFVTFVTLFGSSATPGLPAPQNAGSTLEPPGHVRENSILIELGLLAQTRAFSLQAVGARGQNSVVPISVSSATWNPNEETVTFSLRNDSAKTITAWDVQIRLLPDGSGSLGHGADSYVTAAGLLPGGYHILPGGSVTRTVKLAASLSAISAGVEVTPTAAIFFDKSIVGDQAFADVVFQRRDRDRLAWQEVVIALEQAVTEKGPNMEALRFALSRIDASLVGIEPDSVRGTARTNLALAISDVQVGRDSAQSRLDSLKTEARKRLVAATTHSRP